MKIPRSFKFCVTLFFDIVIRYIKYTANVDVTPSHIIVWSFPVHAVRECETKTICRQNLNINHNVYTRILNVILLIRDSYCDTLHRREVRIRGSLTGTIRLRPTDITRRPCT